MLNKEKLKRIVKLNVFADYCKKEGLNLTSELIKKFIKEYIEIKGVDF